MKLHHIPLTKKQLDAIPEAERNFIVSVCHALNELNVLMKLLQYCINKDESDLLLKKAQNVQTMTLLRVIVGKTNECWNLLDVAFFLKKKKLIDESELKGNGKNALNLLKQYFKDEKNNNKNNLITTIRNEYSFHYSHNQIPAGYKKVTEDDKLDIFLSRFNGNTLFVFAETIVSSSMQESINPADHSQALDILAAETNKVIEWFNIVIPVCLLMCLNKSMNKDSDEKLESEHIIDLEGLSNLDAVKIPPFFVEIEKNDRENNRGR